MSNGCQIEILFESSPEEMSLRRRQRQLAPVSRMSEALSDRHGIAQPQAQLPQPESSGESESSGEETNPKVICDMAVFSMQILP